MSGLRDIEVRDIEGRLQRVGALLGKATLIVNVASECGFTPQYEGLEALYRRYRDRGLQVLGFPCNQFGHQEPGTEEQIRSFCTQRYGVTFPMFAKIDVNGAQAHPLFRELKRLAPGLLGIQAIKWNFTKFLVDGDGTVLARYAPTTSPQQLEEPIVQALGAAVPAPEKPGSLR